MISLSQAALLPSALLNWGLSTCKHKGPLSPFMLSSSCDLACYLAIMLEKEQKKFEM